MTTDVIEELAAGLADFAREATDLQNKLACAEDPKEKDQLLSRIDRIEAKQKSLRDAIRKFREILEGDADSAGADAGKSK